MDLSVLMLDQDRPWAAYAACRETDPDLFFPAEDADPTEALKICAGCAVRDDCLDYGFMTKARYGIWGGTTERERKRLLRRTG